MGCFNSKHASPACRAATPIRRRETAHGHHRRNLTDPPGHRRVIDSSPTKHGQDHEQNPRKLRKLGSPSGKTSGVSLKSGLPHGNVEAEQVAAGWPAWLSSASPEAVHGWVPLRAEAFEKLEKIGQGTYSSVFRACEVATGRVVALKKVRIDNFQADNIRFMAREIMILRRLDHQNIMKLEGIIASRSSNSMYFVFEYMEHDLAGLSSSPDIKFTEAQMKCYMKQLLWGVEHCHLRGIMHRDIKASNILVNNQGILKLADFGLANIITPRNKNQLTSRVVTLWYRAPELLMGSTNYGVSVDLWSVGCVFAEILIGKPILKGRTEIEQLHKIYKLCGSPSEEFWEKTKVAQATMFKPQHSYEGCLRDRCKEFPSTAVNLLETFLSMEPEKRGTASSALISEYFNTKPYPCDPSTLPKYPPNKEMDAKHREELRRKRASIKMRDNLSSKKPGKPRRPVKEPASFSKLPTQREMQNEARITVHHKNKDISGAAGNFGIQTPSETSQATATTDQGDFLYTGLSQTTVPASGFAWGKKKRDNDAVSTLTTYNQPSSGSHVSGTSMAFAKNTFGLTIREEREGFLGPQGSSDAADVLFSGLFHKKEEDGSQKKNPDHTKPGMRYSSGPVIFQSNGMNEILRKTESNIRISVRRPQLERGQDNW